MAYNPIQFQQGMSLPEFFQSFGTEAACVAAWADEAPGPTSASHSFGAGGFGAETLKKLRQRHALLELDGVVSHSVDSLVRCYQPTRAVAHQMRQA